MPLVRLTLLLTIALAVHATTAMASFVPPVDVPEPASLLLLAVGLGGVAVARKFRGRK